MKNSLLKIVAGLTFTLIFSVASNAMVDTGRQYSSTKETKGPDELTLRINQLYRTYVLHHANLTAVQKKELKTGIKSIYRQLKNQPGPANSWKKLMTAWKGAATTGNATSQYADSKATKEKKKFFSFLQFRAKPVLKLLNTDVQPERKPKRNEFKLFKWVE